MPSPKLLLSNRTGIRLEGTANQESPHAQDNRPGGESTEAQAPAQALCVQQTNKTWGQHKAFLTQRRHAHKSTHLNLSRQPRSDQHQETVSQIMSF